MDRRLKEETMTEIFRTDRDGFSSSQREHSVVAGLLAITLPPEGAVVLYHQYARDCVPPIPWPGGVSGSPASNIRTFEEKCLHSSEKYDIILSCQNHTDKINGRIPEWPKGTDCKSAANCFGGSNPPPSISCAQWRNWQTPGT